MFGIDVDIANFTLKIQEYQRLTQKGMMEVIQEQSRLLAKRLVELTPPFSKQQGLGAIKRDIQRVYLRNQWWEEKFQFRKTALGDRIKEKVRAKDANTLFRIFLNSSRLNKIKIEPFDPKKHQAARFKGRVSYPEPYSYPLSQQTKINQYIRQKQKLSGMAKSGWGNALSDLGGKAASWYNKAGCGGADLSEMTAENPAITIINRISYFSSLNSASNIVSRALEGRGRDMLKSAENALRRAAKEAGLESH